MAQGHLAREQMASAVDEVVEMSRRRSEELRKVVQKEKKSRRGIEACTAEVVQRTISSEKESRFRSPFPVGKGGLQR